MKNLCVVTIRVGAGIYQTRTGIFTVQFQGNCRSLLFCRFSIRISIPVPGTLLRIFHVSSSRLDKYCFNGNKQNSHNSEQYCHLGCNSMYCPPIFRKKIVLPCSRSKSWPENRQTHVHFKAIIGTFQWNVLSRRKIKSWEDRSEDDIMETSWVFGNYGNI